MRRIRLLSLTVCLAACGGGDSPPVPATFDAIEEELEEIPPFDGATFMGTNVMPECGDAASDEEPFYGRSFALPPEFDKRQAEAVLAHYSEELTRRGWKAADRPDPLRAGFKARRNDEQVSLSVNVDPVVRPDPMRRVPDRPKSYSLLVNLARRIC